MEQITPKKRKRRADRNHIIYVITNIKTKEKYVGLSVCIDKTGVKTLKMRWTRHIGRAYLQNKNWTFCQNIREYGPENFKTEIKYIVRGKAEAFAIETKLRKTGKFKLNTA